MGEFGTAARYIDDTVVEITTLRSSETYQGDSRNRRYAFNARSQTDLNARFHVNATALFATCQRWSNSFRTWTTFDVSTINTPLLARCFRARRRSAANAATVPYESHRFCPDAYAVTWSPRCSGATSVSRVSNGFARSSIAHREMRSLGRVR